MAGDRSLLAPGRMKAYSDAVFSIIATVMILPIAHSEIKEKEDLMTVFNTMMYGKISIYLICFFIVASLWKSHVLLFDLIETVDEITILLNLIYLMLVTFLPFTFTLWSQYALNDLAIGLMLASFGLLSLVQKGLTWYVFRTEGILKEEIVNDTIITKNERRNWFLVGSMVSVVFLVLSAVSVPINSYLSIIMFIANVFRETVRRLLFRLYYTYKGNIEQFQRLITDMKNTTVCKERIEAFSDGVFAIVATLIILDICEGANEYSSDLLKSLTENATTYMAYAGTFVTVGMLWFVHHSLFKYLTDSSLLMGSFNNVFLACIGLTPLAFKLTSKYKETDKDELVAIQVCCAITCLAGLFQALIWVIALYSPQTHIHPEAVHGTQAHFNLCTKLAVYPFTSLLVYVMATAKENLTVEAFYGVQLGTPILFLLLSALQLVKLCSRQTDENSPLTQIPGSVRVVDSADTEESLPSVFTAVNSPI